MSELFDAVVVGSGPSGAMGAAALRERGLSVLMLDVGNDDPGYRALVPDRPFDELRRADPGQSAYFLGRDLEGVEEPGLRAGSQLTPPRRYITRDTERFLPCTGDFAPVQSLALGGLGAGWGAACFTYTREELRRVGIDSGDLAPEYEAVAQRIGVSAAPEDDVYAEVLGGVRSPLPALQIDANAARLLETYRRRRGDLERAGLRLGRPALAVLSRERDGRRANAYHGMDFWSDAGGSVFRPRYLVEALKGEPGFTYRPGLLVQEFRDGADGVAVGCRETAGGARAEFRARRLLLCAGAVNSARIALQSLRLTGRRTPVLCNPFTYLPCVHLPMLGRETPARRHSLTQLVALLRPEDDPEDAVLAQFYSYPLLLYRLAQEMPLPPWAGLQAARLLAGSLTLVVVSHSDAPGPGRWMRLSGERRDGSAVLEFSHAAEPGAERRRRRRERALGRLLRRLGCLSLGGVDSGGPASSLRYAGTVPFTRDPGAFGCDPRGRLHGTAHVFVGDGAAFNHLPAKAPTFTLMANARRVARHLAGSLAAQTV